MRADTALILDRVEATGIRLCRDPFEGTTPPEYEVIAVNGSMDDEQYCEPLVLAPRWPGRRHLTNGGRVIGFCKTGRHPYDLAVTAIPVGTVERTTGSGDAAGSSAGTGSGAAAPAGRRGRGGGW
jgi:hypothetical protein